MCHVLQFDFANNYSYGLQLRLSSANGMEKPLSQKESLRNSTINWESYIMSEILQSFVMFKWPKGQIKADLKSYMESEYFLLFEYLTKYIPQVFNIFIYFIFAWFVFKKNIHKMFILKPFSWIISKKGIPTGASRGQRNISH